MHISAVFWPILAIRRSSWGFLRSGERFRHIAKQNYFILNSFIETADYSKFFLSVISAYLSNFLFFNLSETPHYLSFTSPNLLIYYFFSFLCYSCLSIFLILTFPSTLSWFLFLFFNISISYFNLTPPYISINPFLFIFPLSTFLQNSFLSISF